MPGRTPGMKQQIRWVKNTHTLLIKEVFHISLTEQKQLMKKDWGITISELETVAEMCSPTPPPNSNLTHRILTGLMLNLCA